MDMKEYFLQFDHHVKEALAIGAKASLPAGLSRVSKVFFFGMGGSAISGDILRILSFHRMPIPMTVHRGSAIPGFVDKKTLVIFSSYSGNTLEVLEALKVALKTGAKILIVTSGGRLAEIAQKKKLACLRLPKGIPPRCAIGYLAFSPVPFFQKAGWIELSGKDVRETLTVIRRTPARRAKKIARKLFHRNIHLYGLTGLAEVAAFRWKTQFAENAKALMFSYSLPELFHNEIEGWYYPERNIRESVVIFLADREDPLWIQKKRIAAQAFMRRAGAEILKISSQGRSRLARLFYLISLGDWVSYELALLRKIDPLQIVAIDSIKRVSA